MKRILLPTDFSEVANNAFVHALEFAKLFKSEIVLLHSFELPVLDTQYFPENYAVIFDSIELSKFDKFKEEIPKLRKLTEEHDAHHIKLSHRLKEGGLAYTIKNSIKDDEIDFLVMGTSGASGWTEFFVGSNTSSISVELDIPVLCVPKDAVIKKIKNICFTTRFREKDLNALENTVKIAKKANARISCLYIKTSESDVKNTTIEDWKTKFKNDPVDFFIIENEDIEGTILEFIEKNKVTILAMLVYKRNFFTKLLSPSIAQKFSNHLKIPVLVLR